LWQWWRCCAWLPLRIDARGTTRVSRSGAWANGAADGTQLYSILYSIHVRVGLVCARRGALYIAKSRNDVQGNNGLSWPDNT
jgi:hypothetical protein